MTIKIEELKKATENRKIVLGSNETVRKLKQGLIEKIFIASNTSKEIEEDIRYNASIAKAEVEKLNIPNDELGMVFKRTHTIQTIGLIKD